MLLCTKARQNCSKVLSVASWNSSHACCIAAWKQESTMPVFKHFYPKCQRKDPNVTTCEDIWSSLPTIMVGCDESIAQTNESHGSHMEVCPFGHHALGTSWAQMEICPAVVDCDQMPHLWRWWISSWQQWHWWWTHGTLSAASTHFKWELTLFV